MALSEVQSLKSRVQLRLPQLRARSRSATRRGLIMHDKSCSCRNCFAIRELCACVNKIKRCLRPKKKLHELGCVRGHAAEPKPGRSSRRKRHDAQRA